MTLTRIVSIGFLIISAGLIISLTNSFVERIQTDKKIVETENRIIEKLKIVQKAQVAHLAYKGTYASNWEQLTHFIKNDSIYVTERIEKSIGAYDSIQVTIDTLFSLSVKDSLFKNLTNSSINTLSLIPGSNENFSLYAGKVQKDGILIDVFEVIDIDPINPKRKNGEHPKGPLKIGSKTEPRTSGNWK